MMDRTADVDTEKPDGDAPGYAAVTSGVVRLHDQAFEILSRRIRAGMISPGEKLLESRIAADFGISRAPARHALSALERAGLVTRADGRGYLVLGGGGASAEPDLLPLEPVQLSQAAGWERIFSEIETSIVSRTPFGSWQVIEAEIAKHHRVSRTVARDVIARLNQRGIIRKDERARWYAPGLSHDHVAELYEMRWTLEPVALLKAAATAPPELVRRLRGRIEDSMKTAEGLSGAELDVLEAELHVEFLGHCGQRTLMEALRSYQSLLVAHSFLYRWLPPLYPSEPFLPEHLAVLVALDDCRPEAAADALRRHLQASLARALARIEAVAADFAPADLPYLRPI